MKKKKPDPVVEKLDEILKTLRRIETKPVGAPAWVPFYYYPPITIPTPLYPTYPQITWANPSITVCSDSVGPVNGESTVWSNF